MSNNLETHEIFNSNKTIPIYNPCNNNNESLMPDQPQNDFNDCLMINQEISVNNKDKNLIKPNVTLVNKSINMKVGSNSKNMNKENTIKCKSTGNQKIMPFVNGIGYKIPTNFVITTKYNSKCQKEGQKIGNFQGGSRQRPEMSSYELVNSSISGLNSLMLGELSHQNEGIQQQVQPRCSSIPLEYENIYNNQMIDETFVNSKLDEESSENSSNDTRGQTQKQNQINLSNNSKDNISNSILKNSIKIYPDCEMHHKRSLTPQTNLAKVRLNSATGSKCTPKVILRNKVSTNLSYNTITKFESAGSYYPFENKLFNLVGTPLSPKIGYDHDLIGDCNDDPNVMTSSILRYRDNNLPQSVFAIPSNILILNGKIVKNSERRLKQMNMLNKPKLSKKKQLMELRIKGRSIDIQDIPKLTAYVDKKIEDDDDVVISSTTIQKKLEENNDNGQEAENNLTRAKTTISPIDNTIVNNSNNNNTDIKYINPSNISSSRIKPISMKKLPDKTKAITKSESPIRSMANKLSKFSNYDKLELNKIKKELVDNLSHDSDDSTLREYVGKTTKIKDNVD